MLSTSLDQAQVVKKELQALADPVRANNSAWFFKTGLGQYGEGDQFLGIRVPQQRIVAKQHLDLSLPAVKILLQSPIHEHRLTAVLILAYQYKRLKADRDRKVIVDFYLANSERINNWDLVDSSASYIWGDWLLRHRATAGKLSTDGRSQLIRLAKSKNLWQRRISIIATGAFIQVGGFDDTFLIAEILMRDKHDLIHKAVGWMLREVGKKDDVALKLFLNKHATTMPRTMLRYAIEKFSQEDRKYYMESARG